MARSSNIPTPLTNQSSSKSKKKSSRKRKKIQRKPSEYDDENVLKLTLKMSAFEIMVTGEKTSEFRTRKDWIETRLYELALPGRPRKVYQYVTFVNGYGDDKPWFTTTYAGFTFHNTLLPRTYSTGLQVKGHDIYEICLGPVVAAGNLPEEMIAQHPQLKKFSDAPASETCDQESSSPSSSPQPSKVLLDGDDSHLDIPLSKSKHRGMPQDLKRCSSDAATMGSTSVSPEPRRRKRQKVSSGEVLSREERAARRLSAMEGDS